MHTVTIEVSDRFLSGLLTGGLIMLVLTILFAVLGTLIGSVISLGGSTGFWKRLGRGTLVLVPLGLVLGGLMGGWGWPWWAVALGLLCTVLFINLIAGVFTRRT